jgi:hypothetical protein
MKFNWGHAIAIVFILFAGYILYFVYQSFQTNVDLVAEDYYAQEVAFQERIDQSANAEPWKNDVTVGLTEDGIALAFPIKFASAIGEVKFYRPDAKDLDRAFPLELNEQGTMMVSAQVLKQGRYTVQLSWSSEGVDYFLTKEFIR